MAKYVVYWLQAGWFYSVLGPSNLFTCSAFLLFLSVPSGSHHFNQCVCAFIPVFPGAVL